MKYAELHELLIKFPPPAYVKQASAADLETPDDLPTDAFADRAGRQYPTHTKEATWLSNARFWSTALENPDDHTATAQRLLVSAELHAIKDDVRAVLEKVGQAHDAKVTQLPAEDYALRVADPNGGAELKFYPVATEQQVKESSANLLKERYVMPLDWRRMAASALLKRAEALSIALPAEHDDYLRRAAGRGISSVDTLSAALTKRADLLFRTKHQVACGKVLEAARELTKQASSRELSAKVAALLDAVDRESGLHVRYITDLPLPEESCFQVLRKHAQAYAEGFVKLPGGNSYSVADVAEALAAGKDLTVPSLIKAASSDRLRSALEGLTAGEAARVSLLLHRHGVKPSECVLHPEEIE